MHIYFFIGLILILINIIFIVLTCKLKRNDFKYDNKFKTKEFPYGFTLIGVIVSILVFIFGFIIEYLCSNSLPFLLIPVLIGYPIYYYFLFLCNFTKLKNLHKKEFFCTMFALVSLFYLLFIPLANDVSLSHQLNIIISTHLPLLEIIIILYVNIFIYIIFLNIILYFDVYNYVILKKDISSQQFRQQHSTLSIAVFIFSGYIASILLNSQFIIYPDYFNFEKFQNIILIYQIFLSSVSILISMNKAKISKHKSKGN